MKDKLFTLAKDTAIEIGKNTKVTINLAGKSGAVCLTLLGMILGGTAAYGIYCWHDSQIHSLAQ